MLTKKFTGATLDETLKAIKSDMGPDAIILKTVTNKGLKRAFNKNRIEITAAIPEKDYASKLRVDKVLKGEQRESFYNGNASAVSESIKNYSKNNSSSSNSGDSFSSKSYGSIALNKQVKQVGASENQNDLDQFLLLEQKNEPSISPATASVFAGVIQNMIGMENHSVPATDNDDSYERKHEYKKNESNTNEYISIESSKITSLEKKISALEWQIDIINNRSLSGLSQIVGELQCLGIDGTVISSIIKKATSNLSSDQIKEYEEVYNYVLKELLSKIHVDAPLFSSAQLDGRPSVNVFYSEVQTGQSSLILKLMSMINKSVIINYFEKNGEESNECDNGSKTNTNTKKDVVVKNVVDDINKNKFSKRMMGVSDVNVNSLQELISEIRKSLKDGKTVFVNCRFKIGSSRNIKRTVDALKMAFEFVETYLCLSAINSELYNKKMLHDCSTISDGIIFTYIDQCLSFSQIMNVHMSLPDIPIKFFSTGAVIPDDIEIATPERLIAGIFKL